MFFKKIGIGIDIVDIERFKKLPQSKYPEFYNKIFLRSEIEYCNKFKNPFEHFAGKFALKEAVKKSIKKKISFLNIETYHSKNMAPKIRIIGNHSKNYNLIASISHEQKFAIAVVFSQQIC